jgi:glycosyltransferase involved in cell wall biosynthesis
MKVLMLAPSYSPKVGGTERVVQKLATKLNQEGIHTDVMTFKITKEWNIFRIEIIKNGHFSVLRVPSLNFSQKMKYNPLTNSLELHAMLNLNFTKYLKDYDILHYHDDVDLSFPFFSCFIKKPKIFQCHTLTSTYKNYKTHFFPRVVLRRVADAYTCVSAESKKSLSDLGIPNSKIFILPNGIDPEEFRPGKREKIDNMVLHIGRGVRTKGLSVLLDSLKYLEDPVSLKIAGPVGDIRYIEEILGSNHKRKIGIHEVESLGYVTEAKLLELYQRASIFVAPSLREEFGIVNLEALSCETPVVASAVGGIREIIKNDVNGLLVPPNDPEKLAKAVEKLLRNKELRIKYGVNGRRIIKEHFSWNSITKELISIYETTAHNYYNN